MALGTEAVRKTEGPQKARQRSKYLGMPSAKARKKTNLKGDLIEEPKLHFKLIPSNPFLKSQNLKFSCNDDASFRQEPTTVYPSF